MSYVYESFETAVGIILIVAKSEHVVAIRAAKDEGALAIMLAKDFPNAVSSSFHPVIREASKELKAYFNGTLKAFTFPVMLDVTPFQRKVLEAMATIPYGKTVSYSELAAIAGNASAFRAAASTCAQNALALFYPCHRVLHKDGSMSGYAYGTEMKAWLLAHEAQHAARQAA